MEFSGMLEILHIIEKKSRCFWTLPGAKEDRWQSSQEIARTWGKQWTAHVKTGRELQLDLEKDAQCHQV